MFRSSALWIFFLLPHKLVGFPSFVLLVTSFAGSLESDPLRTFLKCSNHRAFTSSSSFDKNNSFLQFLAMNKLDQGHHLKFKIIPAEREHVFTSSNWNSLYIRVLCGKFVWKWPNDISPHSHSFLRRVRCLSKLIDWIGFYAVSAIF